MKKSLLITGASGYIGKRLAECAAKRGYNVLAFAQISSGSAPVRLGSWRLGDEISTAVFEGVDSVIHLAYSMAADSEGRISSANANAAGSEKLASAALVAGVGRFVFASTTSARPDALNIYGRVKYSTEERLLALKDAAGRVVCARIGLVYGGPERGLYGVLSRLARLTPVLPMVGISRRVQPIHIDEVCEGLLALATAPLPRRESGVATRIVLAGPQPVAFGDWLRMLRKIHTGKRMWLLPIPASWALLFCELTRVLPIVPTIDRERVLGLLGSEPVESASDLAALKIIICEPSKRLSALRSSRRRNMREAAAMLSYLSGRGIRSPALIARLVHGIERQGTTSLGLPRLLLGFPALLRAFEPIFSFPGHRLAQRLHLAAMVLESTSDPAQCRYPSVGVLVGQVFLELVALPLRLVLGRTYA